VRKIPGYSTIAIFKAETMLLQQHKSCTTNVDQVQFFSADMVQFHKTTKSADK